MMLVCNKCAARFESLIITRERAVAELSKHITLHWTTKHKEEMEEIGKGIMEAQMAFAWYVTMNSLAFIPKDETYLLDQMEKSLDLTMKALGYDEPDDTEDEGDEEEEGEEGEEGEETEEVIPPNPEERASLHVAKSPHSEAETRVG